MADVQITDLISEGVFASRPAAAVAVEYYATDTKVRYYSDGASWTAQPPTVETHVHSGADITSGTVVDARLDAALARDSEVASAISTHAGLSDPHPGYTTAAELAAAKLDDFATPDDNTDLNATTSAHGLLPKLGGGSTNYLRADGTWATPSGGGGGATPTILLDYTQSSDITALSVTASTWTDIIANQNFTVANAGSLIEIVVRGFAFVNGAAGQTEASTRVVIDSAGTPINEQIGGNVVESGASRGNPFAGSGSIFISGLSAAVHTMKPQIYFQGSNSGFYCRPSGSPPEFLRIQVIEHL